jgi:hypothetical protein
VSKTLCVSLDGIRISKEDTLELVNRMNEKWPGKYWLVWRAPLYSNAMLNPNIANWYQSQTANPVIIN